MLLLHPLADISAHIDHYDSYRDEYHQFLLLTTSSTAPRFPGVARIQNGVKLSQRDLTQDRRSANWQVGRKTRSLTLRYSNSIWRVHRASSLSAFPSSIYLSRVLSPASTLLLLQFSCIRFVSPSLCLVRFWVWELRGISQQECPMRILLPHREISWGGQYDI